MGKKRKRRREPRAEGKRIATGSNYIVHVKKVGPFIFQELRKEHNVDRAPFERTQFVPETGATLRFPYIPPDEPPLKEEDIEEWSLYHEYQNWYSDFEEDVAEYMRKRNRLLLDLAVTHIKHKDPKVDIEYEMNQGSWIEILGNAGIEVNDRNLRYLFLKTVVLQDEQDYLTVLNEAIAEEVSLGDVLRAFEYFQDVLERSGLSKNLPEPASGKQQFINESVGSNDGHQDEQDLKRVVSDRVQGESTDVG